MPLGNFEHFENLKPDFQKTFLRSVKTFGPINFENGKYTFGNSINGHMRTVPDRSPWIPGFEFNSGRSSRVREGLPKNKTFILELDNFTEFNLYVICSKSNTPS